MSDLFLDQDVQPEFKKIAMPVKLSDSPENWQKEIAAEIYKQCPFLGEYAVNIILDKVDPQRGFAFGAAEVSNQTQAPTPDREGMPNPVRVPLIVKDRLLQPIDVFIGDGEAFPLNEARLREHLFRTDTFELSTRKPTDTGMVDQLYPPLRTNYGYGNAVSTGSAMSGFGKVAGVKCKKAALPGTPEDEPGAFVGTKEDGLAKRASLLDAIASTIQPADADAFVDQISKDREIAMMALTNGTFQKTAMRIAAAPVQDMRKTAEMVMEAVRPTVVQFTKLADGNFLVKWANADAFNPQEGTVPPEQAEQMAGTDAINQMQPGQSVTVGTEKAQRQGLEEVAPENIDSFGQFRCWESETQGPVEGTVLPVMDFDLQPLDLKIFVANDGSAYGCQDELAGVRIGHEMTLPGTGSEPQGDGCFIYTDEANNRLIASPPLTVKASITNHEEGGVHQFHLETVFGEEILAEVTPGLQAAHKIDEGHYAIPDAFQWLPLQNAAHFARSSTEIENMSAAQGGMASEVGIKSTGEGEQSLEGMPVDGIPKEARQFIKTADAEFLLVSMGVDPFTAREKIAASEKWGYSKVAGCKTITTAAQFHKDMVKKAARALADFPYHLRRNLVKEAAALEDSESVDNILAMGFLNPENLGIFASYLPQLDQTASKLAEMLIAARLGMNQVPEGAVERAMKNLEEVILGLKTLEQKQLL
jgi:hypothetical protein